MGRIALLFLMYCLGVAAICIGSGNFLLGPDKVAKFFADPLPGVWPNPFGALPEHWTRDADNEMRFYAVFWFAYGVFLITAARNLEAKAKWHPPLFALFFAGGIGRLISITQVGAPHMLFVILMGIELILPIAMYFLYRAVFNAEKKTAI